MTGMAFPAVARFVALLAAIVAIGSPAVTRAEGDFCTSLKAAVGDYPNGFRSIRAGRNAITARSKIMLPGMSACEISNIDENYSFWCTDRSRALNSRSAAIARVQELKRLVSRCFPGVAPRQGRVDPRWTRGAYYPEFIYSVGRSTAVRVYTLLVAAKAKKGTFLYDRHVVRVTIGP